MKREFPSILNLGLASVITIFIILSVSIFASLTLLTAYSDHTLSQKTADRATQVCNAYNKGEALLKDIDDILIKSYNSMETITYEEYCSKITETLDASHLVSYMSEEDSLILTADIAVNDTQALHIELIPVLPENTGDSFCTIKQWKILSTKTWEKDDSLHLLNPRKVPGKT